MSDKELRTAVEFSKILSKYVINHQIIDMSQKVLGSLSKLLLTQSTFHYLKFESSPHLIASYDWLRETLDLFVAESSRKAERKWFLRNYVGIEGKWLRAEGYLKDKERIWLKVSG